MICFLDNYKLTLMHFVAIHTHLTLQLKIICIGTMVLKALASYKLCLFCDYPSFGRVCVLYSLILRAENTEPERRRSCV